MFNRFKEDTTQLKDIDDLIKENVSGKVIKHEVAPLTAFGENFGSEILRVEITVEENGQEKTLHAVAKLIPPTEMQLQIFNTQVTFKNEVQFLAGIAPLLQDFQREHHFSEIANYFPELYGSRISLKPHLGVVDNDAVILMENLKISGYDNIDRQEGFDLDAARKILRVLANLQATALAIKLKRPDVFNSQIRPYLTEFIPPQFPEVPGRKDPIIAQLEPVLKENHNTAPFMSKLFKLIDKQKKKRNMPAREPWATIVHNDLWVNNIMIKHKNHEVTGVKLVDFQVIDYGSPIKDLMFFLFSSVQNSVLKYHFDKLILHYYNEFAKTLQQLKVDMKDFTYEHFQEELKLDVSYQIFHAMFMIGVVFGPKGMPKRPGKVAQWNPEGQSKNLSNGNVSSPNHAGPPKPPGPSGHQEPSGHQGPPGHQSPSGHHGPSAPTDPPGPPEIQLSQGAKERIWFIVEEGIKRNWI